MITFMNADDTYELVRKIQLSNIVAEKKRKLILCTKELVEQGKGLYLNPKKILFGLIQMKDGSEILGLIVNHYVLFTLGNDKFAVTEDEQKNIVIAGDEILDTDDYPYQEQKFPNINLN